MSEYKEELRRQARYHIYINTYIHAHTHIHVCGKALRSTREEECLRSCANTSPHTHTYTLEIQVCMYTHTYIYIYIYYAQVGRPYAQREKKNAGGAAQTRPPTHFVAAKSFREPCLSGLRAPGEYMHGRVCMYVCI